MDRLAFRCSANACFMPSEEYPAFSQNSTRGKTRSPIGVFSPSFPSRLSPMALFKRSSASLTLYQDFAPLLVRAHLDVESQPLAHGTAGSENFCRSAQLKSDSASLCEWPVESRMKSFSH